MEKRIVLPTDFSKNALNAITYVTELYKDQTCIFYLLNAFWADKEPTDIAPLDPEPGDLQYEAAKKISNAGLATLMHEVSQQNNPKHSFHKISSYSSLLFALKETITKNVIGLAVIGTQGA